MATIRKRTWSRANGEQVISWQANYVDSQGVRRAAQFQTKREAKDYLETVVHEVRTGVHAPPSQSITVAEAVKQWLEHCEAEGLERSTRRTYRMTAEYHLLPFLGRVMLAKLTRPMVKQLADDLLAGRLDGGPRSRLLVGKTLGALKSAISEAQDRGQIAQNVARGVTVSTRKRDKRKLEIGRDVPDVGEVNATIAAAVPRWRPLIVVAAFCGLRASELRGLRWRDVDLEAKRLHVRQRLDRWGDAGNPKSEAGQRSIPMMSLVLNALKEWRLACPRPRREDGTGELDLVFPADDGGPLSHSTLHRAVGVAQLASGIATPRLENGEPVIKRTKDGEPVRDHETGKPVAVMAPKYHPHAFRHFFCSWLIRQGFQPKRVQVLMGHASFQMTMDRYGHWMPDDDDDHRRMEMGALQVVGSVG
jgi:integrase